MAVAASLAGCGGGGEGGPEPGSCVPGMTVACACLGSSEGVQTCSAEGTFSACQCLAGTGGSSGTGGSRSGGSGGTGGGGGHGGTGGVDAVVPGLDGRDALADSTPVGTASLRILVVDVSDSPLAQATVKVLLGGAMRGQATTAANGIATVTGLAAGEYSVQASAMKFDPTSKAAAVADGATADLTVQLIPTSAVPAGGTHRSEAITIGTTDGALVFEVDLFVLDRLGRPVDGLTPSAFSIEPFTDTGETLSFSLQSAVPLTKTAKDPYSAYLMLDQSGSITTTDPGNLRLQAAKIFLGKLGAGDQVVVGAFASSGSLPFEITQYQEFTPDGRSFFPTIDQLASKEGGGTPLYKATVSALQTTAEKAPTANKAALIFTDGEDTGGGYTIDQVIAEANRLSIPLHMVGLGKDTKIDVLARLAYGTGGSFMQAVDAGQLIALYGNMGALLRGSTGGYRTRWTATLTPTTFAGRNGWFWTSIAVNTDAIGRVYVPIYVEYPGRTGQLP
jgi:hypothetical protein